MPPKRVPPAPILIGESAALRAAREMLDRAAPTSASVLLEGEPGTGKRLGAELLRARGPHPRRPLVVVDCTSVAAERLAACLEMTGATVLLDELAALAPALQAEVAGALRRPRARLVAAVARPLAAEIEASRVRGDLFHAFTIRVQLPPLRERLDDLPLLIDHFLAGLDAGARPEAAVLRADGTRARLARHMWPGNVAELRATVERFALLGGELPGGQDTATLPLKEARARVVRAFEADYLRALLCRYPDSVSAAARAAGVDRITFYRLLGRHGLQRKR